jgi:hypothetical protein
MMRLVVWEAIYDIMPGSTTAFTGCNLSFQEQEWNTLYKSMEVMCRLFPKKLNII